jgi:protein tyrosine phosphatase
VTYKATLQELVRGLVRNVQRLVWHGRPVITLKLTVCDYLHANILPTESDQEYLAANVPKKRVSREIRARATGWW